MSTYTTRKKDFGIAGNGGEFHAQEHAQATGISLTEAVTDPRQRAAHVEALDNFNYELARYDTYPVRLMREDFERAKADYYYGHVSSTELADQLDQIRMDSWARSRESALEMAESQDESRETESRFEQLRYDFIALSNNIRRDAEEERQSALFARPLPVLPGARGHQRRLTRDQAALVLIPGNRYEQKNIFEGEVDFRGHAVTMSGVRDSSVAITYPNGTGGGPMLSKEHSFAADDHGNVYILDEQDRPTLVYQPAA
jgi:hypothetical protein